MPTYSVYVANESGNGQLTMVMSIDTTFMTETASADNLRELKTVRFHK